MPTIDLPYFATRLRVLLAERGWSAKQLAREAGVNQSTVASILTGDRRSPQWDTVRAICDALGCSADEFRENLEKSAPEH